MKTKNYQTKNKLVFRLLVGLCLLLCLLLPLGKGADQGSKGTLTASAESSTATIEVDSYDVEMTVLKSRKVEVKEQVTVKFLTSGTTMFFRSLPTDGTKYADFKATCPGNDAFHFNVVDNPDTSGFIDVECIGGVGYNKVWTYYISYTMMPDLGSDTEMIMDVIGFGWGVPLNNVTATVRFPVALTKEDIKAYVGGYGTANTSDFRLSNDGKTLKIARSKLPTVYNSTYNKEVAAGITVQFRVPEGTFVDEFSSRFWTKDMWKLIVGIVLCAGLALFAFFIRPKRDIITVVNIKPPEKMDPLQMGKLIDGTINNEDVTAMIYYFAHKGYIKINFTDEDDPEIICLVSDLPPETPAHEKTLFYGLFPKRAPNSIKESAERPGVKVSTIALKFFEASQRAKMQVPTVQPMYDWRSKLCFFAGGVLALLFVLLNTWLFSSNLGGGYFYFLSVILLAPAIVTLILGWIRENYRYKWKPKRRFGFFLISCAVSVAVSAVFIIFCADHLMTGWEKAALCIGAVLPPLITERALMRSQKYIDVLDDVLGFREFILVTEEEKIEFMLQENPELYYDVLPYAQVLGVTDEWDDKFAKLTIAPPSWYEGSNLTVFDYMIINRCMTRSMMAGLAAAAQRTGSSVGGSGGGRSFGGFGGGGFGGGGGGAR